SHTPTVIFMLERCGCGRSRRLRPWYKINRLPALQLRGNRLTVPQEKIDIGIPSRGGAICILICDIFHGRARCLL
ncbi:hypothetical protein N9381_10155, partial [Paracoccaceae bacterium]|nr:hypothetical protein [Paracoccaceae bacterium]